jgi:CHAT domain-containing protein
MYQQALPYFDNAMKIAGATPDAGYPFLTDGARVLTLLGLGQITAAQGLVDEIVRHAQVQHRIQQQAIGLNLAARVAQAQNDQAAALFALEQSRALAETGGYVRELADTQSLLADIYRARGDLRTAEHFATLAAVSTQASADSWSVPDRLKTIAELDVSQGKYTEADRVYDRAAAFIDSLIGNYSTVLEKTALITASSELYSQHFALVAERFNDVPKAYHIVEQVRGRATTDLLMAGSVASEAAKNAERTVAQLRLKLMAAGSANEVHRIRDQVFMAEQSRWITPEVSILNTHFHRPASIARVQRSLKSSAVILEYVVADPRSYCLVISHTGSHIVRLGSKHHIEMIVAGYLKAIKAKQAGRDEGRQLYDALLRPIPEAQQKQDLVVIRDGQLHLAPFDAFIDTDGRYVVETHTVVYAPSATSFCLLTTERRRPHEFLHTLLAVGGITYNVGELKQAGATRGYEPNAFQDLPASREEVLAVESAFHDRRNTLLIGSSATKTAFKRAGLADYRIIHLAVHGFSNSTYPDRAALVFLSDPAAGEDGFLQASEIVQLRLNAQLVVLSACDTAVGPVEGEEGIATLSRAFLLAGAKTVVSTLWSIDDTFSLTLMRQFYQHLAAHQPVAYALTAAKRDVLQKYGREAVPYYWAGFTLEGVADLAISSGSEGGL